MGQRYLFTRILCAIVVSALISCAMEAEEWRGDGDEVAVVASALISGEWGFVRTTGTYSNPNREFFPNYATGSTMNVERYVECDLGTEVLTGVGGRVANGNFSDLTAYCSEVASDGKLRFIRTRTAGGSSQEKSVIAEPDYAITRVGGIVTNDNVYRLVIRMCPWLQGENSVSTSGCYDRASGDGPDTSVELNSSVTAGAWGHLADWPSGKVVASGFGMTTSNDNIVTVAVKQTFLF